MEKSYLMILCGVIIVCTYVVVDKLNEIKSVLDKSNALEDDLDDDEAKDN